MGGTLLGAGGLIYAREIETRWLEVRPVTLTLPRLAPEFDGYRIVQIGDIHLEDWTKPRRLNRIVELVNEQQADLITITGDFLSYSADPGVPRRLVEALGRLRARDGVVAVMGNHDYMTDVDLVRRCLKEAEVPELRNDVRTLWRGDAAASHRRGGRRYGREKPVGPGAAKAAGRRGGGLAGHEPDFADVSAAAGRLDLQLSGHSHGGQVRMPFWGPVFLPPHSQRYSAGLYEVGGMLQYTNRGLGFVDARLRFLCRPEITVLNLRAPQTTNSSGG